MSTITILRPDVTSSTTSTGPVAQRRADPQTQDTTRRIRTIRAAEGTTFPDM
jgi:hypothetical protein